MSVSVPGNNGKRDQALAMYSSALLEFAEVVSLFLDAIANHRVAYGKLPGPIEISAGRRSYHALYCYGIALLRKKEQNPVT